MPQGINTGEILEALNDKMDRDGHNVESPSATVVETYDDGNGNGYILLSNNWCEQYGMADVGATSVTFLKPFANNKYNVQTERIDISGTYHTIVGNLSTTGFDLKEGQSGVYPQALTATAKWKAEGYIS